MGCRNVGTGGALTFNSVCVGGGGGGIIGAYMMQNLVQFVISLPACSETHLILGA